MTIFSLSDLRFIKPLHLKRWLAGSKNLAVVDVRDSDYFGGHIKRSYNFPSENFQETLPELRRMLIENNIEDVVFHCALSQVRGPKAALKYLRSLELAATNEQLKLKDVNVWVLQGGFTRWQSEYGTDTEVTEDYIEELWK